MFTTFDKAIAGLLTPLVAWLATRYVPDMPAEVQAAIVSLVTAGVVWVVPNKAR